jgi:hypothetical protein
MCITLHATIPFIVTIFAVYMCMSVRAHMSYQPADDPAAGQAAEFAFVAIHTLHKKPTQGWAGRGKQQASCCLLAQQPELAMRACRG